MDFFVISVTAFLAAILTFFSGFGLGTILTPVFMLYFPTELAVALTGVVHFFNNLFKLVLVGRNANREVLIRFGIPAVLAAIIGSWLLLHIADLPALFQYSLFNKTFSVYPVKFVIGVLLFCFAWMDVLPSFQNIQFGKDKLPIGGALSGFFGGLSGNQGALRSAFLLRAGLSKEAFISTAVVLSTFVDITRLSVYATRFSSAGLFDNIPLVLIATLSAIAGAFLGNKLLKKVTLKFIQLTVAILLMVLSLALGLGIV